ncbi:MAG: hypothetical protein WDN44_12205 [Sphingomonas sp.]
MLGDIVGRAVEWAILAWFALVLASIGWQVLAGRMPISGMVARRDGSGITFHRLQMVGVTLLFALAYLIDAIARGPGEGMPDISTPILAVLIGSHATYLGGKAMS